MDELYRQFLGVVVVLGALVGLLWFVRNRGLGGIQLKSSASTKLVKVVERVALTPQHTLFVVSVGDRTILLTSSPNSCQLITDLPSGIQPMRGSEQA